MFGRNLEVACKANQRTKHLRLENAADNLAAEALRYPVGSPEWKKIVADFVKVVKTAEANGTPITR